MKNFVKKITVLAAGVLSAAMCLGTFAACQPGNEPEPEVKAEYTAAKSATCTAAGNTAYWVKDGKYYSDEACTKEIAQADTVVKALGHDFDNATYVSTDATQHWKVCARTGCDVTSTKEDHKYTDGKCVCGKDEPAPEVPQHVTANAPTCGEDGNIEYWTLGGKYYSDEACTQEITEADTVDPATGDHTAADEYTKDADKHYHACTVCGNPADEKGDHTFTDGECTVCGKTNGFENTNLEANEGAAATREDTGASVKIKVTTPGDDWHVKFFSPVSGLEVGDAFVVKYALTSTVDGTVGFEIADDNKNDTNNNGLKVKEGANVITAYGVVHNEGDVTAVLKVGAIPADGVLEITSITCEKLTGHGIISTFTKPGDSVVDYTINNNADGSVKIAAAAGDGTDWHLKLEQRLNVVAGKTYDMVYVIKVNAADVSEGHNIKLEVGEGIPSFTDGYELYWFDKGLTTVAIRFRFTATKSTEDSLGTYTCLLLGQLANATTAMDVDISYAELIEVA